MKIKKCSRCKGDGHWHSVIGWKKEIPIVKCPKCKGTGIEEGD